MSSPELRAKRILLVEDEQSIGAMCRIVLSDEGFEVDVAADGSVARAMIEERDYDLCLIDMLLPKMSGQALYEWLQSTHPRMADSVVFTTGSVIDAEIIAFIEGTGRPFLAKPFTPTALTEMVKEELTKPGGG